MHIAHVTRVIWEHGIRGGMEQHSRLLIRGLQAQGHHITTITTTLHTPVPTQTICVPKSKPARYSSIWWQGSVETIQQLHHEHPIDVIWSQSTGARAYAIQQRPLNIPCVFTLHGTLAGELKTRWRNARSLRGIASLGKLLLLDYFPDKRRWAKALPHINHFVAVSDKVSFEAQETMRIPTDKLTTIPNGVDTNQMRPAPAQHALLRQKLELPAHSMLFLAAGRLHVSKGIHLAIEALAQLKQPNVHLLIAGAGPQEDELKTQVHQSGLQTQVHFLGFVPNEQLPAYFQGVNGFIMPTLRDEGLPIVLLEAMACGLPILITDAGGIPTAIRHEENGLLLPMGDLSVLTHRWRQLLEASHFRQTLGEAARRTAVNRFSLHMMTQQTLAVFDKVRS